MVLHLVCTQLVGAVRICSGHTHKRHAQAVSQAAKWESLTAGEERRGEGIVTVGSRVANVILLAQEDLVHKHHPNANEGQRDEDQRLPSPLFLLSAHSEKVKTSLLIAADKQ